MAQGPAAQYRLVACECVQRPPFSSLVGRAAVEHFYVMLLHCRRGSRTRKGDRHLAKHHQMDRPARVVAGEEQDMTDREDILRMAREAHRRLVTEDCPGHTGQLDPWTMALLARFAALVAAAEREACLDCIRPNATPMEIAAAIRARGNK